MISYKQSTLLFKFKQDDFIKDVIMFYESLKDGVKSYHNTVMKGVEVNDCATSPP